MISKKKSSLLIFITALTFTLLQGLLGVIVTRLILTAYGSDFNGVNATANQFINVLLLLEGGVTLATNVALFKPVVNHDTDQINEILAATSKIFHILGVLFLIIGVIGSFLFVWIIKSDINKYQIFLLFLFTVIPSAINLFYTTKYAVLLQAGQKEYLINNIRIIIIVVTQILIILVAIFKLNYLLIRAVHMIFSIISSILIVRTCKKRYSALDLTVPPNFTAIKGTKDVIIQKVTSLLYGTAPILYISIVLGTIYVSVYAVYNSIFIIIKNLLYSLVNAPRMSFGVLIAERDNEYVKEKFLMYEFLIVVTSAIFFSSVMIMIPSFISIYTAGITDANYNDQRISLLLSLIGFIEIIHIPSGHIINMSGNFAYSRKIQSIATIILIISIPIASHAWGFIGILASILCAAIALAIMEIGFIHIKYFIHTLLQILLILSINMLFAVVLCILEIQYLPSVDSYWEFFMLGVVVFLLNAIVILSINFIFIRNLSNQIFSLIFKAVFKEL